MAEDTTPKADYDVGYRKPPKHTQFVPGQSGNAGRRKKKPLETPSAILGRILGEVVEVGGRKMTKLELAAEVTLNRVLKSGTIRDFEKLADLIDKSGLTARMEWAAEQQQAADDTMKRISTIMQRTLHIDAADVAAGIRADREEAAIIMGCSHCGPIMRERWKDPEYKSRSKRGVQSQLHKDTLPRRNRMLEAMERTPKDNRTLPPKPET